MTSDRQMIEDRIQKAVNFQQAGAFEEALTTIRGARLAARDNFGDDDPLAVSCLSKLGLILQDTGAYSDARECFEQALAIRRRVLGDDHPDTADSLGDLGCVLQDLGQLDLARPCLEQALEIRRRVLGDEHPDTAVGWNNLGLLLFSIGEYAEARSHLEQALRVGRLAHGEDHPGTAANLSCLGSVLQETGDLDGARECFEKAVEINTKALGETRPETAGSLNLLGELLRDVGEYDEAKALFEKALDIRRRTLGEEHPATATSYSNLGVILHTTGDYARAKDYCELALHLRLRILPPDHPQIADSYFNLASLHENAAEYALARSHHEKALSIYRRALGEEHPRTIAALNSLGLALHYAGAYGEAKTFHERALELRRRVLGDHPDTAQSLHNLGMLHQDLGDHAAARRHLESALDLYRRTLGDDHSTTAATLGCLGLLLLSADDVTGALPYLEQALDINRRVHGGEHLAAATSLNDMGLLYHSAGAYREAIPYYEEALALNRRILGEDHPRTALCLNNLGSLLDSVGEHEKAISCVEQALAIRRRVLGNEHPDTAASLGTLGHMAYQTGDYSTAQAHLEQALAICRRSRSDHQTTSAYLQNLSSVYVALGRVEEAWELECELVAADDRLLGQVISVSSERQRVEFFQSLEGHISGLLSIALRHFGRSPEVAGYALDTILRRKALGAEALASQRDAILGGRYPHLSRSLHELGTLRERIVELSISRGSDDTHDEELLAGLAKRRDHLEAELARQIPEMNLERKLRSADRRAVALALDAGVALIEFVRFHELDCKAIHAKGESRWKPARYLAFVLPAGAPDDVCMVDLGEAAPIDRMIADFRTAVSAASENQTFGDSDGDRSRDLVRRGAPRADTPVGRALRAAIFDPLAVAAGVRTRLLISPDGQVARLAFAALPTDDDRRLADTHQISYVGSGRDVLGFAAPLAATVTPPLVVCDPDFDMGHPESPAMNSASSSAGMTSRDLKKSLTGVTRLPGTLAEGVAVGGMLGVVPWHGRRAMKQSLLRACRSPRVLHLATHGFFLEDQEADLDRELWGPLLAEDGRLRPSVGENPLLRSGLVLAGANTFLGGGLPPAEGDNGLLTALEVSGLDLLGTDLVVLSACRTGEGDVQVGEGVIGLQRAFTVAGARTLVMSLWGVDDEATRDLMVAFYRRLLDGEGKADALRHAQDELRATRGYADPYYWAAFVCQGDPGPLRLATT